MDYNSLASVASIMGVIFAYFSFMKDKLKSAEELGQLKQKVDQLEKQSLTNEIRFQKIETKLDDIQTTLTRLETLIQQMQV